MTVTFRCPSCHTAFRVEDSSLGKIVMCPKLGCNRKVTLPNAGGANLGIQREGHETAKPPAVKFPAASLEQEALPRTINGTPRSIVMLVAALLLFITVAGALATTVMFFGKEGKPDKFSEIVSNAVPADGQQSIEESKAIEEQAARVRKEAEEKQRTEQLAAEEAEKQKREADMAAAEKAAADEAARKEAEAKVAAAKKLSDDEWEKKGPFVFIGNDETRRDSHGQWLFELPKAGEDIEPEPLPLSVKDQIVELALFKGAEHLNAGSPNKLVLIQSPEDPNKWIAKANEIELAEYMVERIDSAGDAERSPDHLVHFQWLPSSNREPGASELLRWWPLQIRVGDRSAVLLQSKAVFPATMPTWQTLMASNDFTFPKSDEFTGVALNQASQMSFDLEVTQAGQEPQKLTTHIAADGDEDPDAKNTPGTTTRYFHLALPLKFVDVPPAVDDSPLGFGTVKMRLSYSVEKGLKLRPITSITVPLPKQDLLDTLPSPHLLEQLTGLAKDPAEFMTLVGAIDAENDDKTRWPVMQKHFDTAMEEMKAMASPMRTDPSLWHTQPLTKLPGKDSFDSTFKDRANAAKKVVRSVIPDLEKALKAAQIKAIKGPKKDADAAQDALDSAIQYEPAVTKFTSLMNAATESVEKQIESLLQDYGKISTRVQEFLEAAHQGQFQVRCQLSGQVETPGSDNGDTLRVYFLESFLDVAP